MNETPELHRPFRADDLPSKGLKIELRASPAELEAIAERLGLVSLNLFEGDLRLQPEIGRQISLTGPIRAEIVQNCVVTGELLTTLLEFELDRSFAEDADPEIEEPDPIIDGKIDVGEQAVEELALNIPPYPRAPGAVFEALADDSPDAEAGRNPFSVLSSLKNKMNTKD
jgi:uncharacterized metal-binding protein YceD (DUF177 family)